MAQDVLVVDQATAARMIGLSPRTLERWRVTGRGPAYRKLGKRVLYTPEDLALYLRSVRRTSTSADAPADPAAA